MFSTPGFGIFFQGVNLGNRYGGVNGFQIKKQKIAPPFFICLESPEAHGQIVRVHEIGGRVVRATDSFADASAQSPLSKLERTQLYDASPGVETHL